MGRVRVYRQEEPLDSPVWPGEGYVDLAASGVIVGIGTGAVLTAVQLWIGRFWPVQTLGMMLLVGGAVVTWRQFAFERRERYWRQVQEAEIERRWLEVEAMRLRAEPAEGVDEKSVEKRLDELAKMMIVRSYSGQGAERERMTEMGLCTQPEWNQVNGMLQEAGIRKGKRWAIRSADEAWRRWQAWRRSGNLREVVMGGKRALVRWGEPFR